MKAFNVTSLNKLQISCTTKNTILSLINYQGFLVFTISCGHLQYTGAKKATEIASKQVISYASKKALQFGYRQFLLKVKGIGKARSFVLKEFKKAGLPIVSICASRYTNYV